MPEQGLSRQIDIKRINRNRIYRFIYQNGKTSKQEIAYKLNMSLPTITQNLRHLQELELVEENGLFESTGGRKARVLSCVLDAKVAIGLDITKNHAGIVGVDLGGNVIRNIRVPVRFADDEAYFEQIGALVEKFIDGLKIDRNNILGVGIAVPGILSADHQTVVYASLLGFTGGMLERFARYIPYPCVMSNDANAAGTAEMWNTPEHGNIVYLSLSDSVGGSIFVDNELYTGNHERSAEFGHMTIVPDGRPCYCGKRGCVDAYCSVKALLEGVAGTLPEFFSMLRDGDRQARARFEAFLDSLAVTLNNIRMLFDCEILLGGYLGGYLEEYLEMLQHMAAQRNTFEEYGKYVRICHYRLEAAAVGAALLHIGPFIEEV
ncbi:MAG: ROK family transcriptional regulator [Oscillospiraceae bacterium]|jgi:predicted NBD/HSP70 family sugar kinase